MVLAPEEKENCYMIKEILSQGSVFKDLCSKFVEANYSIKDGVFPVKNWNKIVICASGSSKNAGEIANISADGILLSNKIDTIPSIIGVCTPFEVLEANSPEMKDTIFQMEEANVI